MITKYIDFIKENIAHNGITPEEIELLEKYKVKNYSFNQETGLIDVIGSVIIKEYGLTTLPKIRFGKVTGSFVCQDNALTSLEYSPKWIGGDFFCNNNRLTSLEYCPVNVQQYFLCNKNNLTSLQFCPVYVGKNFNCSENKLTSLKHCPEKIGSESEFNCHNNLLNSLEYGPKTTVFNYDCSYNKLTDLKGCPEIINGSFVCSGNPLVSLDYSPKIVKHSFYCDSTRLVSIEDYPIRSTIGGKISTRCHFPEVLATTRKDPEKYEVLKDHKIAFHQQIMKDNPHLIQYYPYIDPPSRRTII